jgi:hypothetical protein
MLVSLGESGLDGRVVESKQSDDHRRRSGRCSEI